MPSESLVIEELLSLVHILVPFVSFRPSWLGNFQIFPGFLSAIFWGFIDKALSETQEFAGDLAERGPRQHGDPSPNFKLRCPDLKLSQVLLVIVNILKLVKNHDCGGGLGNGGFFLRPRSKLDVMLRPMNQRIYQQICALTQWPSMTLFPFLVPLQHACVKFWWC